MCLRFLYRYHCCIVYLLVIHEAIVNLTLFSYIKLDHAKRSIYIEMDRASDSFG